MTLRRRPPREIPLRFDDGFRGNVTIGTAGAFLVAAIVLDRVGEVELGPLGLLAVASVALAVAFVAYVVWTHRVFSRPAPAETLRIAAAQHRAGTSVLSRMLGVTSAEGWAVSASAVALVVALLGVVFGSSEHGLALALAPIALLTAVASWTIVVCSFALRYLRLHAAGERFEFVFDGEAGFDDFVTMALTISCAGSLAAASPRTRAGLMAVRAHMVIAFGFNALIVALLVSVVVSVAAGS